MMDLPNHPCGLFVDTVSLLEFLPQMFMLIMDASDSLPAISDPDKRDNGATGLCYQFTHSMGDVEYQSESTIDTVLADYSYAHHIAR